MNAVTQPLTAEQHGAIVNGLSVDVEDWFQVGAFENVIERDDWNSLADRVERNVHEVLDLFDAAEAKATEVVSAAIVDGGVSALNYFVANKYVEALKAMADSPNQKMLLMPIEATGIIGSLAGIAELARNALDKQQAAEKVPVPRGPAPPPVR